MTFKIEKEIPIPKKIGGNGRLSKYPYKDMDIGDSFFVEKQGVRGKAVQSGYHFARKHGKKFTARPVEGGVRIWRVE